MAKKEPPLYMTNWNKFEEAVNDVVRKEVCRVFLWLYRGGATPVWEYLDEVQGGKSGLNKDEKDTLRSGEPATNMDISLLYRLLQRTCGLAEDQSVWHSPPDPSAASLEHTLYLVKKERNKVGHEGHTREAREMSDDELDRKLSHLRSLCADLLTEAARRCGRSGEAVKLVDKMEVQLQEIRGVTADRFVLMAREEKLRVAPTRMADEWYQQPSLRLQGRAVGLADVLQRQAAGDAAPSFLLVSGEAGVGKSSLCSTLAHRPCKVRLRKEVTRRLHLDNENTYADEVRASTGNAVFGWRFTLTKGSESVSSPPSASTTVYTLGQGEALDDLAALLPPWLMTCGGALVLAASTCLLSN